MSSDNDEKITHLRPKRPCPQCGKASAREAFPFCSKRCQDVDLNNWLSGNYAIAATEEEVSSPQEGDSEN